VKWSREIDFEVGFQDRRHHARLRSADEFPRRLPRALYRNDGGGKFTDVSAKSGIQVKNTSTGVPVAKTLGVAPVDLNNDGWMDFIVANDTVQNFVFTNAHDGTFKEIGALSGVAFDANGQTRGAMGIDTARYRNDGTLGIGIGNFANEMTAMYVSQRDACSFVDEAIQEGVGPASRLLLKFGLFFFDYDLDGWLDLLTSNGHLEEEIAKIQASQKYHQPAQLFWNHGTGFSVVPPAKAGAISSSPSPDAARPTRTSTATATSTSCSRKSTAPPLLLRNDQNLGHHFLRLKLVGTQANRDAIGAWVKVRRGNETLAAQVMPTRSYFSQSEFPVTIGLGKTTAIDDLEITWPGGEKQTVESLSPNTTHTVKER
jgi:hypothetical protein